MKPLGPNEGINRLRHLDCKFCDEYQRLMQGEAEKNRQLRQKLAKLMTMSSEIRKILLKGGSSVEIKNQARREGMRMLIEDGWRVVSEGITTPAEVLRVSKDEGNDGFAIAT
jgi:type II secretory ATPase GspE/PulE/Tfp pilus assembly ATPase PilB-like protein